MQKFRHPPVAFGMDSLQVCSKVMLLKQIENRRMVISIEIDIDIGAGADVTGPDRADKLGVKVIEDLHHLERCFSHLEKPSGAGFALGSVGNNQNLVMNLLVCGEYLTPVSTGGLSLGLIVLFELSSVEKSGSLDGYEMSQGALFRESSLTTFL